LFDSGVFEATGAVSFGPFVLAISYSFRCQSRRLFKATLAEARNESIGRTYRSVPIIQVADAEEVSGEEAFVSNRDIR
jgi:hypothetical protein